MENTSTSIFKKALNLVNWLLAGFVLPCTGTAYYRKAIKRNIMIAILFFVLFNTSIAAIKTWVVSDVAKTLISELKNSYENGSIPDLTIRDGKLENDFDHPVIFYDDNETILLIDTTGTNKRINDTQYEKGMLLTKYEVHVLNNYKYDILSLSDLNTAFDQNPVEFNAQTVIPFFNKIAAVFSIAAFFLLLLWNLVARFMIFCALGVIIWGISTLFSKDSTFSTTLITGIYVFVPVYYLDFVLNFIDLNFPGLQTILLVLFWSVILRKLIKDTNQQKEFRGARMMPALLGIPSLILMCVSAVKYDFFYFVLMLLCTAITAFIFLVLRKEKPEFLFEIQKNTEVHSVEQIDEQGI